VFIRKMDDPLTLVHPLSHDFYESCRSKLGWGSRLGG
ncbi:MAG: NAD(+) kinase, partial [Pseudomonadales bacterium]|nr:NAD(+) kinase [Pseudomonadales bacterium]